MAAFEEFYALNLGIFCDQILDVYNYRVSLFTWIVI